MTEPAILRRFRELNELGDDDLAQMAPALREERFKPGALICSEGDEGDCCWFLLEGSVDVVKMLPDGRRVKLATLPAGTVFGQSGLVPGQKRTADVKAAEGVHLLTLKRRAHRWSLGRGEGWAVAIQAIVAINLVRQLRSGLERLSELAAAEDPSLAITGRTRASIPKPISLDVHFKKRAPAGAGEVDWDTSEVDEDALDAPAPDALLSLLRATDPALASSVDIAALDDVEIAYDEDQRRTAAARDRK